MELLHSLLYMLNGMSPYILLGFLLAGVMHAFIPRRSLSRHLSGTDWKTVLKAAAIGVPLPLCSCGVLPTAIGMRRSGASRAASTSFLVATPQTGVDSIAATWSLLGPAFAVIRPVAALVTAAFGGVAVGYTEKDDSLKQRDVKMDDEPLEPGFFNKLKAALKYGFVDLVGSIGAWLTVGLIVAAIITVYVPSGFFSILGNNPALSMIAVLIIAIPMYVCATGSIPIAMSLMLKGLSPGTAFVLIMAGPAANFASFTLISREMGRKAATVYLAAIVIGAMAFGLTIDYLLPRSWFDLTDPSAMAAHSGHSFPLFSTLCSAVLIVLLLISLYNRFKPTKKISSIMAKEYVIKGMNCPHCQAAVTKSIAGVAGVDNVVVNLQTGIATVDGAHDAEALKAAVREAGFDVV